MQTESKNATLPAKLSALPESWVSRIFSRMSAFYGSLFRERWRDCDLEEVKAVWADELASFSDNPETFKLAIAAMVNECKFPPTLPEFVSICRKHYKRPQMIALEHKPTTEDMERNKQRVAEIAQRLGRRMAA